MYSAPKGWKFVNFIHFLAPFVILGIGLDDIFVSIAFFQNTRPFMGHFALDTRLTMAFQQASSAMLATCVSCSAHLQVGCRRKNVVWTSSQCTDRFVSGYR